MKIDGYKVFKLFNTIIMLLVIIVTAYPIYYVVIASFSNPESVSMFNGILLLPLKPFTLDAYKMVFANNQIMRGFLNTAYIMFFGLAVNMFLTIIGAYFLTIKGPMLKNFITYMIVFTMYFGGGMIPSYLNIKELGLLDSLWAVILPAGLTTSNLIIMKTAFQSVPDSLVEAARLDGASYLKILIKVMLPLSKATLAVIVLYYGVARWNSWFSASIYLNDSTLFPLQLVMRNILNMANEMAGGLGANASDMSQVVDLIQYALIVVATAPILVLYPFLQKYFVRGVMVGAIKG